MPSLATLSILRLPDAYLFQLQLPGIRQPATTLAKVQPLPSGSSALPQQIEETIRLLNRLIVQRQPRSTAKASPPPAVSPGTDLLQSLGRLLYNQLLPPVIQQGLRTLSNGAPLLLMTNHSELPWELLHDGEQFLAAKHPMGRQMMVDTPSRLNAVRPQRLRTTLLIGNPTGDLPQAEQEIEALLALLETLPDMAVPVVLMQGRAGKNAVLKQLVSGDYDLIHYSGHAAFDPLHPQASRLVLAHNTFLTAAEIKQNLAGQPVVFLNGCESARGVVQSASDQAQNDLTYLGLGLEGLATAFLQGGAQSFVGTLWPIADIGSQAFSLAFHRATLQGESMGAALRQARNELADPTDPLWASYVLYGDPELTIAPTQRAKAQPATVLAVRFWGLPALLVGQLPEAAAQQIEAYLLPLTQTIQRCGGQVQSLAYHTLIAIFGIPQTQENDAERAVQAALDMLRIGRPVGEDGRLPALTCSIGLGSGDVLVNPLPLAGAPLPIISGQVVESALQLAEQGAPGEILLAESTRRLIRYRFELSAQVGHHAGGAAAYRVLGRLPESEPFWPISGHQTALIGRQQEWAMLEDAWQRTCQGQGQIVDVVGGPGVGKSRLLYEFYNSVGKAAQWLVIVCPSAYAAGANWLIGQLARLLLGVTATEEPTALRGKLHQALGQASPESLAVMGDVLGLDFPAASLHQLDQQVYQRHLIHGLEQWLVQKADETPLVLVLEDLHRADEASLTVLKQLVARLDHAPILVIALFRVEGDWQSPWRQRRNQRLVTLNALDASEGQQLLGALLETVDVSRELAQVILAPAEGNPFFIRELVFSLRDAQALRLEQGAWRLARAFQPHDIPDSLERLIRLRVNSVTEPAQNVLALLSVAGDNCEHALLKRVLAGALTETLLEASLDELVDKELIGQRWEKGKQICRFPHALIQSVVYESLRSEERRRYHRRLRQTLEQVYQGREADILELLAHHAYQSVTLPGVLGSLASVAAEVSQVELACALGYLEQSGVQANRRYAARQAITYYQQALLVSAPLPAAFRLQQAACYEGMGDAHDLLGEYAEAIAAYQMAYTRLTALPLNPDLRRSAADLSRRIGRMLGWSKQFEQAHEYMQKGLEILDCGQSHADIAVIALIHTHTGSLYYLQKQMQRAEQACRAALTLVEDWEKGEVTATAANVLGVTCMVTGRWAEAITRYQSSLELWQQLNNQTRASEVMDNLGNLYFLRGEFTAAEELYQHNLRFFESIEASDHVGYAILCLSGVYLVRGALDKARQANLRALTIFQQTHKVQLVALSQNNLGFLELACKNFLKALHNFLESIKLEQNAENLRGASEAHLALGNCTEALEYAQQSLLLAREESLLFEEGVTLRTLGRLAQAEGNFSEARQHFQVSYTLLQRLGAQYELGRTLCHLARLEQAIGHHQKARQDNEKAVAIFKQVGAYLDLELAQIGFNDQP